MTNPKTPSDEDIIDTLIEKYELERINGSCTYLDDLSFELQEAILKMIEEAKAQLLAQITEKIKEIDRKYKYSKDKSNFFKSQVFYEFLLELLEEIAKLKDDSREQMDSSKKSNLGLPEGNTRLTSLGNNGKEIDALHTPDSSNSNKICKNCGHEEAEHEAVYNSGGDLIKKAYCNFSMCRCILFKPKGDKI